MAQRPDVFSAGAVVTRKGGDVLVVDENGESFISGADFALALVDEIVEPKHNRARFTVAY